LLNADLVPSRMASFAVWRATIFALSRIGAAADGISPQHWCNAGRWRPPFREMCNVATMASEATSMTGMPSPHWLAWRRAQRGPRGRGDCHVDRFTGVGTASQYGW
jgi:hypothetical protein